MKAALINKFRNEGANEGAAQLLLSEAKVDILSRNQCRGLELAHRDKLIRSGGVCRRCSRKDMLTVDHLIPRILLAQFGVDVEREFLPDNLILLCRPCNSLKSGNLDFSFPETKTVLLELLNKL